MREGFVVRDLLISGSIIILIFTVMGCIKSKTDSVALRNASVETSLRYFIQSDRQNAFDELHNGFVKNISIDKAEIIFDISNKKIEYIDEFNENALVRIFYEKGVTPLEAYSVVVEKRVRRSQVRARIV